MATHWTTASLGTEGTGSAAAGPGDRDWGRQGCNTTCAAEAQSRSSQFARVARSGQRRGGAVRTLPGSPPHTSPSLALRVSHRAHGSPMEEKGQGQGSASTHTVIGHQGIQVILQEKRDVSTQRAPVLATGPPSSTLLGTEPLQPCPGLPTATRVAGTERPEPSPLRALCARAHGGMAALMGAMSPFPAQCSPSPPRHHTAEMKGTELGQLLWEPKVLPCSGGTARPCPIRVPRQQDRTSP